MTGEVRVAMVGIWGYGAQYLDQFLDAGRPGVRLVAGISRRPERCKRLDEVKARGIAVYPTLEEFYRHDTADLVIINSPIHVHCEQTCEALAHGSHVLCEKPVAATVQEGLQMLEASAKAGKFAAIGYQWSFAAPIQALKADILAGRFGRPLAMKTLVFWPRTRGYYERDSWAGAIRNEEGKWILDSPVGNATAHFLHNMFYLLGKTKETAANPVEVQAELYRANPIQNYDTAALRVRTDVGVALHFYTSHAVPSEAGPVIRYDFENGVVYTERGESNPLLARMRDGTVRNYGELSMRDWSKIWQCAEATRGGTPVACDVRTALPMTVLVNGAQESMWDITPFPKGVVRVTGEGKDALTWVAGLPQTLIQCYDQCILPSEHGGVSWSRKGEPVDLRDYRRFPSKRHD